MKCYVYMIRCKNFALYTGVTIDYLRRWEEHSKGQGARYIKENGFVKPVFLQEFPSKSEAMREERYIKSCVKYYKELLVKDKNLNLLIKCPNKYRFDPK